MKENSIEEDIAKVNTYIELVLEKDYCNCNELNTILGKHCDGSKNVAYAIEHILSDYKRVLKENEELKQDRNNNYQMIALAQNEALGYMQGYEDGKKLKRSAVANIVENQQYYIFNKQIEHYEEYIVKLQKENEELKNDYENLNNSVVVKNHCIKNSIPVQKVKDKIRKNEEIIDISNDGDLIHELYQENKVYEELLESEE